MLDIPCERKQFCQITLLDPEHLKSMARRDELPVVISGDYSVNAAFLTLIALEFSANSGMANRAAATAANLAADAFSPLRPALLNGERSVWAGTVDVEGLAADGSMLRRTFGLLEWGTLRRLAPNSASLEWEQVKDAARQINLVNVSAIWRVCVDRALKAGISIPAEFVWPLSEGNTTSHAERAAPEASE